MSEGTKQTPVHSTVTGQRVPLESTLTREHKEGVGESGERLKHQLKQGAEHAYEKACDMCHNWRHYPKLLTTVVLLTTFLLGSLTAGGVQRMGFFGGSRNYVSSHWDRETSDAHHALDVVLDHLKHPHLYQTEKGTSYVSRARSGLMSIFEGILPGRRTQPSYGRGMQEKGRELYDEATGRSMYDKATGRGVADKMGEYARDLSYGARRGMEQVTDTGYGIGHKLSDMAAGVKNTLVGDRSSDYGREARGGGGWFGGGQKERPTTGGWFGGEDTGRIPTGHDEYDEFGLAADKIKKVVRTAEREM